MKAQLIHIAFVIALLLGGNCIAQKEKTATDSLERSLLHNVPVWMAEYHVPCVGVGLIENGKIKWVKVFGDSQKGVNASENTLFNIASQTKPVVGMLVLKLVQLGQWNLDEPLSKYWIDPDIANDPFLQKLTTRTVLRHQTGFSNWRSDSESNKLKFNFEPGTKFGYSGEGFEYLRRALENKFQQPLDKLLDSFLFKPLGMNDTGYWSESTDMSRFAAWHDANGNEYPIAKETPVSAADDLISSISDYCKLGIFVMNGAGLSRALFDDMVKPQVKIKDHSYRGLGWGLTTDLPNEEYALDHGGSDMGVRTMAIFLPKSKNGIVLMTNGDNGMFVYNQIIKAALPYGEEILDIMSKGQSVHERIALADSVINSYVGVYQQNNGKEMQVTKEGNAIKVSGDGMPTAILFPESANKFFLPDYDVQLEFPDKRSLIVYENEKQVMKINKMN